jgi:hypothetical protein
VGEDGAGARAQGDSDGELEAARRAALGLDATDVEVERAAAVVAGDRDVVIGAADAGLDARGPMWDERNGQVDRLGGTVPRLVGDLERDAILCSCRERREHRAQQGGDRNVAHSSLLVCVPRFATRVPSRASQDHE